MHRGIFAIYRAPLALGLISGGGLVAALLTDGAIDGLWTLTVALPLLVAGWKIIVARHS
jgi:hypothetical protein